MNAVAKKTTSHDYKVRDISQADLGRKRITMAEQEMPGLMSIRAHFDLRPYGIIKMLDLIHPIYQSTASYGHFGRKPFQHTYKWEDRAGGKLVKKSETATAFSWEATDRADALRKAAKIK